VAGFPAVIIQGCCNNTTEWNK